MEIIELNLKHFGKFREYKVQLHPGLNIISGGNETGKSTLHAFIRAMLYGLPKGRGSRMDEYRLRQPREDGGYFAGTLRFMQDGKVYRIERNFLRGSESLALICETDAAQLDRAQERIIHFAGDLSEQVFEDTFFIRQEKSRITPQLGAELKNYLLSLRSGGAPGLDVSGALEDLTRLRRRTDAGEKEELRKIDEEIRQNRAAAAYVRRAFPEQAWPDTGTGAFPAADQPKTEPAEPESRAVVFEEPAEPIQETAVSNADADTQQAEENSASSIGNLVTLALILSAVIAVLAPLCAHFAAGGGIRTALYVIGLLAALFGVALALVLLRRQPPRTDTERAEDGPAAEEGEASTPEEAEQHRQEEAKRRRERREKRERLMEKYLGFHDGPEESAKPERAAERRDEAGENTFPVNAEAGESYARQARAAAGKPETGAAQHLRELDAGLEALSNRRGAVSAESDLSRRAIDLAIGRIRELSGEMSHESGESLRRRAGELLAALTEGHFDSIALDEKMQVRLNTPEGLLYLDQVSAGTVHQACFALRMAAGELLSGGADSPVPLVLDETFAMYDDERLEEALRFLETCGRQVILFTCQGRELAILARIRGGDRG